jgi:hypothetical protein
MDPQPLLHRGAEGGFRLVVLLLVDLDEEASADLLGLVHGAG